MDKTKTSISEDLGRKIGFIAGYVLFTALLYSVLKVTHKIPNHRNILHLMLITLCLALMGHYLKKALT